MRFSAAEVAAAVAGELHGADVDLDGVAIDSRRVQGGELFVPVVAERDGHDFVDAARAAGAAAHLSARPGSAAGAGDEPTPVIRVADTGAALLGLGGHARTRLPDRVVGITGSAGKTSTKDLLRSVLMQRWRTTANEASFNNELGVPLTLANAPPGTEAAVVEMGARGAGHIARLCTVARPTVGVVTLVADAHLATFGSVDDVARAKAELVQALGSAGFAVLNADDHRVAAMAGCTTATVVGFGEAAGDVRAEEVTLDAELRPSFRLLSPWGETAVQLAVHGRHQVVNALAAATAALALGCTVDDVAAGLVAATPSAMRMDLRLAPSGAVVIDDAYNANPTSVRAALDALAAVDADRRLAVLGAMAELGPDGPRLHREVAAHAERLGIRVISVAAPDYGVGHDDRAADVDAVPALLGPLREGDAVLVKGSRVAALEGVVAALLSRPTPG